MKKKLSLMLICGLLLTALLPGLTGCGGNEGTEEEETVRIGCVFPLSGGNALLGEESLRGAQLAINEVNEAGGLWGKQIELIIADAPDVTAGQTETERLITKEKLQLVFGAYSSSLANVCSDVCARYDVPYFELGGIGSDVMQKGYKYLWRTCCDAFDFGETQARFFDEACRDELGLTRESSRVVIAHEDSLFGTSVGDAAKGVFTDLGYQDANVKLVPYSAASVDLSTVILDAKNFKPDCFLTISYVTDAILLGRQAKELKFEPAVWIGGGAGWAMKDTKEGIGKDIYGIYDVDWPQYAMNKENVAGLDEYMKLYSDTYGESPRSGHSLGNYVGGQMMLEILRQAGSLDKDAIYGTAYAKDEPVGTYTGGWGCKFDETGQNKNSPAVMFMWTADELVAVWPEKFAVTELVLPMPSWADKAKL